MITQLNGCSEPIASRMLYCKHKFKVCFCVCIATHSANIRWKAIFSIEPYFICSRKYFVFYFFFYFIASLNLWPSFILMIVRKLQIKLLWTCTRHVINKLFLFHFRLLSLSTLAEPSVEIFEIAFFFHTPIHLTHLFDFSIYILLRWRNRIKAHS